ncbi:MAG: hypothetical protein M1819_000867 [Sarea resinae]|nr:MAG: hypothetical protein M1819_000867 [Sarea resinae]
MHRGTSFVCFVAALLLGLIVTASPAIAVPSLGNGRLRPSHPQQQASLENPPRPSRPWPSRVRDHIIEKIWTLPEKQGSRASNRETTAAAPPTRLLSRYSEDVVLRFNISTAAEAKSLAEAVNVLLLDVWEFNDQWLDIRLRKDVVPYLLGLLPSSLQHAHRPLMLDLAQAIFDSYPSPSTQDRGSPGLGQHRSFSPSLRPSGDSETNIFFQDYQPLSVITPWMRLLHSLFPTHVRMINIGISFEGRDIPALRVGVHPTNAEKPAGPRKTIIVAGGSHAREWISTSTVNYVAYSLITAYGKSKTMNKLIEDFDWVFIPTLNPDGYVFTWENDRLWRKNRQQTSLRFCHGVDLDRSWGFQWDGEATKNNPCSESFAGEAAFGGVESQRVAEWARNETEINNANIVAFLDLHSYSQQVLYPYSFSCQSTPPSEENLEEVAIGLAKAIRIARGESYGVAPACKGSVVSDERNGGSIVHPQIESGGGSALDWFYHELRVRYSYQIKLRDTGSYGFLLPQEEIVPTGKEIFAAISYLGRYLSGERGIEAHDMEIPSSHGEPGTPGDILHKDTEESHQSDDDDYDDAAGLDEDDDGLGAMGWELRRRRRR